MNYQFTFADYELNRKRRKTRKEAFFSRMKAQLP